MTYTLPIRLLQGAVITYFRSGFLARFMASLIAILLPQVQLSAEPYQLPDVPNGADRFSITSLPEWVTPVKPVKLNRSTGSIDYELEERQIRFKQGNRELYYRSVAKANNAEGLSKLATIEVVFYTLYQNLVMHEVSILRNKERINLTSQLRPTFGIREQDRNNAIYMGATVLTYHLPDVRVGDRVEYAYTIVGQNPIYGGALAGAVPLTFGVPIGRNYIAITSDRFFQVKSDQTKVITATKKDESYRYISDRKQLKSYENEGNYMPGESPYSYLSYSSFKSWSDVSRWALPLYSIADPEPTLVALAQKLSRESASDLDYATRVVRFVQNDIRYLSLSLGANSHRPHAPEDVLKKRYGDCKDKSLLITALLAQRGIKSWPALVSSRHRYWLPTSLPSAANFDHVINKIEVDGSTYWVDGTRIMDVARLDRAALVDFGEALIINSTSDSLVEMHPAKTLLANVTVSETFKLDSMEGDVVLTVNNRYGGTAAINQRYFFASNDRESIEKQYLTYMGKLYKDVLLEKPIEVRDNQESNTVDIKEVYRIRNGAYLEKGQTVVEVDLDNFARYIPAVSGQERDHDWYMGLAIHVDYTVRVEYPSAISAEVNQQPTTLYFGNNRYHRQEYLRDNSYQANFQFTRDDPRLDRKKMGEYKQLRDSELNNWYFVFRVPYFDVDERERNLQKIQSFLDGV